MTTLNHEVDRRKNSRRNTGILATGNGKRPVHADDIRREQYLAREKMSANAPASFDSLDVFFDFLAEL